MAKTWRQRSLEVIDPLYQSIKQAQPQCSDAEILRMVSLHYYPFGERKHHPYAAWRGAVRDYRRKLGGEVPGKWADDAGRTLFENGE